MIVLRWWVSAEKYRQMRMNYESACRSLTETKREIERLHKELASHEEIARVCVRMGSTLLGMREDLTKSRESTNEAINKDFRRIAYELGSLRETMVHRESHYAALTRVFENQQGQQQQKAATLAVFSLLLKFEAFAHDLVVHHVLRRSHADALSQLHNLWRDLEALRVEHRLPDEEKTETIVVDDLPPVGVATVPLAETETEEKQDASLPAWVGTLPNGEIVHMGSNGVPLTN